jgi:hypothetical protein
MYCALLQRKHLTTYPHIEPRNHGFHKKSYIEEPHTKEPGPEHNYTDEHVDSRPISYTGGDLKRSSTPPPQPLTNRGPTSSVAVPGTNLHNAATQPHLELLHPQHRYYQPSAAVDDYEWQALNIMPVPRDLKGSNGTSLFRDLACTLLLQGQMRNIWKPDGGSTIHFLQLTIIS